MSGFIKFRSSMGGFNRVDVTNYIEKLSVEHTAAVKKLEKENAELSRKLDQAEADLRSQSAQKAELEEALNLLTGQSAEPAPDYPSMELEAYRRAEATERLAAERAAALQQRLQELTEQISGQYGEVGQEIQTLSQDLGDNLQQLKETLGALDGIFRKTSEEFEQLEETVQWEE